MVILNLKTHKYVERWQAKVMISLFLCVLFHLHLFWDTCSPSPCAILGWFVNSLTPNSPFSPVCFPLYHISRAVAAGKQTTPNSLSVRLFSIWVSSLGNYINGFAGTMHVTVLWWDLTAVPLNEKLKPEI